MMPLVLFVLLLFLYSAVSRRLERTVLTAPIFFTAAGILLSPALQRILADTLNSEIFLGIAEVGLVMLLFTDASRTDLNLLRSIRNLPARLLSIGLLLTILLGAVVARLIFPNLSFWEAGILGAILAPTDAGLGQIIVSSSRVPMRIRQALNVEAGLNDGLSVPFLLFFIALAAAGTIEGHATHLSRFILQQLGFGAVIGAVIGLTGGWLLGFVRRKGWMAESFQQIGLVALPLLCLAVSEMLGASMFIAAFVAGLAVQIGFKDAGKHSVEFADEWGQVLNLSVFFIFGLVVVRNWSQMRAVDWLYAVLSLTVVRMLPVAIALIGTRLSGASVIFMGWFGPRGLASIVLGLVYLERELHLPGESTIKQAVMGTVLLSIFVHGLSAMPGIGLYERKIESLGDAAPEHLGVKG
ncbi:MAG: cation:proton antiporter [Candidatus Korobacteraceae bacterium]